MSSSEPSGAPEDRRPLRADPGALLADVQRAYATTPRDAVRGVTQPLVKVTGRTAPGPGGPLVGPLSGQACVWYRTFVMRQSNHLAGGYRAPDIGPLHEIAMSDLDHGSHLAGASGYVESDLTSSTPFVIDDPDGATAGLRVDPRAVDVDTRLKTVNRVVRVEQSAADALRFRPIRLQVEWSLPVGVPVFAVGEVHVGADGGRWLGGTSPALALVSTETEQTVVSRCTAHANLPWLFRHVRVFVTLAIVVSLLVAAGVTVLALRS